MCSLESGMSTSSRNHRNTAAHTLQTLASCLIYARALLEYVIFIFFWVRSVSKMLPSVKFAENKVLTFLILHEEC